MLTIERENNLVRRKARRNARCSGLLSSFPVTFLENVNCTIVSRVIKKFLVRFPSGTHIFSLSHARDKLNIPSFSFLSELKIYHLSFFIITHRAFDIADPSSMQDACHHELSKYDLARYESPSSSLGDSLFCK